jgi:hypothetical protein
MNLERMNRTNRSTQLDHAGAHGGFINPHWGEHSREAMPIGAPREAIADPAKRQVPSGSWSTLQSY